MNALEKALHERALFIAKKFRDVESELIDILQKIAAKKVFRTLGYASMFQYAVDALKLSESKAYAFINVSRKAKEVPELKTEIQKGTISVCKAKRISSVLNKNNSSLWLEKAKALPQRQLEKEIAKVSPKAATPEKATYVSEKRLNLQLGVSEELMDELRRIQDLLSQRRRQAVTLEEALSEMTEVYLDRHDPVRKAKRFHERVLKERQGESRRVLENKTEPITGKIHLGTRTVGVRHRKPLPAAVKHQVMLRDQGQCSYQYPRGSRCDGRRWLEVHHVLPVSHGGGDLVENLATLCNAHHKHVHLQVLSGRQLLSLASG